MPIVRRTDCNPLPMVVCLVVAVAMLESRVASCVHCVENVADRQHSPHSAHSSRVWTVSWCSSCSKLFHIVSVIG